MSTTRPRSRFYVVSPWSWEQLLQCCEQYLYHSLSAATHLAYNSFVCSYWHFCLTHRLPEEPTTETLSLYITFCMSFVRSSMLQLYLSSICSRLGAEYPSVCQAQASSLIPKTLTGIKHIHSTTLLLVGFDQLLRLAEHCVLDLATCWDSR